MSEMNSNKQDSLSKEIDHIVVLCFGIAFFLIYTASAILLYITEEDTSRYYIKAIVMFLIYLALYASVSVLVIQRIAQLFRPLDAAAGALLQDKKTKDGMIGIRNLAESLRAQSEKVNELSEELKTTQNDLDDAFLVSEQNSYQNKEMIQRMQEELDRLQKRQEEALLAGEKMARLMRETAPLHQEIQEKREDLYEQMRQIEENIRDNARQQEDTAADFEELGSTFALLGNMQTDAEELLENIYNEMTGVQSLTNQINLYAMNTSLDIARAGSITVSAISALDEIKEQTAKMNTKTDDVLLLLIRARNALKLATDQSGECREKGEECGKSFENSRSALDAQKAELAQMLSAGDQLTEDVSRLSNAFNEAEQITRNQNAEQQKAKSDVEKMTAILQEWYTTEGEE